MSDRPTPPPPPFPPPHPDRPPGPPPQFQPGYPQQPAAYPGSQPGQYPQDPAQYPGQEPAQYPGQGTAQYPGQYPTQFAPGYAPGYAPGQPPAPPGGGRNKVIALVAGGVALALVAGLGAWFAFAGSDDKDDKASPTGGAPSAGTGGPQSSGGQPPKGTPTEVDLTRLWTLPAATSDTSLRGGWVGTDKMYVLREKGITVHDLATGKESGKVDMPPGFEEVCSVMDTPVEGVGLFGWDSPDGGCVNASAVDLATGTVLWTEKDVEDGLSFEVALGAYGNTAVVAAEENVKGLDLRSGAERWTFKTTELLKAGDGNWSVADLAVGPDQVALTVQTSAPGATKYIGGAVLLDPAKGSLRGFMQMANGPDSWPSLLSASPMVVLDEYAGPGKDEKLAKIFVFDGAAKPVAEIPVGQDGVVLDERSFDFIDPNQNLGGVEVHGKVLYAQIGTKDDVGTVGAYDLTTGKRLWAVSVGVEGAVRPISADEQGFTALVGDEYSGEEAKVLRFAAADGATTTQHILRAGSGSGVGSGSGSTSGSGAPTGSGSDADEVTVDPEGMAVVLPDNRVLQFMTGDAERPAEMYAAR